MKIKVKKGEKNVQVTTNRMDLSKAVQTEPETVMNTFLNPKSAVPFLKMIPTLHIGFAICR